MCGRLRARKERASARERRGCSFTVIDESLHRLHQPERGGEGRQAERKGGREGGREGVSERERAERERQ